MSIEAQDYDNEQDYLEALEAEQEKQDYLERKADDERDMRRDDQLTGDR